MVGGSGTLKLSHDVFHARNCSVCPDVDHVASLPYRWLITHNAVQSVGCLSEVDLEGRQASDRGDQTEMAAFGYRKPAWLWSCCVLLCLEHQMCCGSMPCQLWHIVRVLE